MVFLAAYRNIIFISPAGAVAKYCNEYVCLSICVFVCLSVHEHISRTTRDFYQILYACCLLPWLGLFPAG